MHACIHECMHAGRQACTHARMHACTHARMHARARTHARTHADLSAQIDYLPGGGRLCSRSPQNDGPQGLNNEDIIVISRSFRISDNEEPMGSQKLLHHYHAMYHTQVHLLAL